MKKSKFILSSLLAGYLVLASCSETRDPSKSIVYNFSADFFWPENVVAGKNSLLNVKLTSDVYRDGFIQHEATFTDDKNSFLLYKGDTIKAGEKFIDKNIPFEFYSEDLGEHNMKFIFKNSMDVSITKKQKLLVEEGTFKFSLKSLYQEVAIDTPLEIEYSIEAYDQLEHSYKLKFEFEKDKNHNATLGGHIAGEWFDISKLSGSLSYIPSTLGTHNVKITSKNDKGAEKTTSFIVESRGSGKPIIRNTSNEVRVYGLQATDINNNILFTENHKMSIVFSLQAYSGNNSSLLKGKFTMKDLGGIEHNFEVSSPHQDQILNYKWEQGSYELDKFFVLKKGFRVPYQLELTNTDGEKIIYNGTVIPIMDYKDYYGFRSRETGRATGRRGGGFRR